jgi:hypothetical protein
MSCDQYSELVELYAVGALEKAEADALRAHLSGGCKDCEMTLEEALSQAALISAAVPLEEPPASLRNRIAASINASPKLVVMPQKKRRRTVVPWSLAAAAMLALVFGIGYEENARREQAVAIEASLASSARVNAERTAAMLAILQAPGTKQVSFDVDKANLPHGSLFIHRGLGVAMVVAHLPDAPAGWKYESWVVPKSGAPQPVESFAVDNNGFAFTVLKGPVDISQWSAMAVSMEPENSKPVKPTKIVFAATV